MTVSLRPMPPSPNIHIGAFLHPLHHIDTALHRRVNTVFPEQQTVVGKRLGHRMHEAPGSPSQPPLPAAPHQPWAASLPG